VSNHPRPLLLSYVRTDLLMEGEVPHIRERVAQFAWTEGFALGAIFVEQSHTAPAAFQALIEAARAGEAA